MSQLLVNWALEKTGNIDWPAPDRTYYTHTPLYLSKLEVCLWWLLVHVCLCWQSMCLSLWGLLSWKESFMFFFPPTPFLYLKRKRCSLQLKMWVPPPPHHTRRANTSLKLHKHWMKLTHTSQRLCRHNTFPTHFYKRAVSNKHAKIPSSLTSKHLHVVAWRMQMHIVFLLVCMCLDEC